MHALADGLSVGRLLLAAVLPWALARGGWLAPLLFVVAAASDYVDGPLARRAARASSYGGVLDNVADVAFVLAGTGTAAWLGLISWAAPAAIACSSGSYALASLRLSRGTAAPRLARSRLGHWAGVCNYACVGVVAGRTVAGPLLVAAAGWITVVVNLAAVGRRWAGPTRRVDDGIEPA